MVLSCFVVVCESVRESVLWNILYDSVKPPLKSLHHKYIDGLIRKRRNFIANALKLRRLYIMPSTLYVPSFGVYCTDEQLNCWRTWAASWYKDYVPGLDYKDKTTMKYMLYDKSYLVANHHRSSLTMVVHLSKQNVRRHDIPKQHNKNTLINKHI